MITKAIIVIIFILLLCLPEVKHAKVIDTDEAYRYISPKP